MSRLDDVFLNKDSVITERLDRLSLRALKSIQKFVGVADDSHSFPAASKNGFDEHRKTDALGFA